MPRTLSSSIFYLRYAWFQLHERFTDFGSNLAYLALYPFFVWLLGQTWGKFNSYQGNYTHAEILVYVSITELLFMTFLRSPFMNRANADFSISLARPRSWLALTFVGQFGATLGGRLIYFFAATLGLHLMGLDSSIVLPSYCRLLLFIPVLGILEALLATLMASAQLLWHEVRYFVLPVTKIFLALGGVFGPLADYGEPGRSIFLKLPASDLFFQVGHYCLKGEFYQMSPAQWILKMIFWILLFWMLNILVFRYARKNHQSLGG